MIAFNEDPVHSHPEIPFEEIGDTISIEGPDGFVYEVPLDKTQLSPFHRYYRVRIDMLDDVPIGATIIRVNEHGNDV